MKESSHLSLCGKITTMSSMAVPTGQGNRMGSWPMYTRASRNFHSHPWYGDVVIQMEGFGHEQPIDWIGQLRLLFHCPLIGI